MIVGLVGAAGAGKDAVAEILVRRHEFVRIAFADALKTIAKDALGWDGHKDARGRRLLQVLGTEAGRGYNPLVWVQKIQADPRWTNPRVVISDVRFQNEADMIHAEGGRVLRVIGRRGYYTPFDPRYWHRSEREARKIPADVSIPNTGTLGDLERAVDQWMRHQNS